MQDSESNIRVELHENKKLDLLWSELSFQIYLILYLKTYIYNVGHHS